MDGTETPEGEPLATLLGYSTADPGERRDLDEMRRLAAGANAFDRSTAFHLTASALIVEPSSQRVLLRWHSRHLKWMQVGGHGDAGELDPYAIARREAEEECGLRDLVALPFVARPTPLQVGVVDVGPSASEPAHRHGDIRYVMATDKPESIVPESDDTPLRWCTFAEAIDLVEEENLRELLRRTGKLLAGITP